MGDDAAKPSKERTSLLFVCSGNTCRSVMAEALTRRRSEKLSAYRLRGSDLSSPADAKNAIETLKAAFGLDVSGHIPRNVRDLDLEALDYVIVLDKSIAKELKGVSKDKLIVWQIDDPWGDDPSEYRPRGLQIMQQVSTLPVG